MEVKCKSKSGLSSKSDVSQTKDQGPVRWKSRLKSDESQTEWKSKWKSRSRSDEKPTNDQSQVKF